MVLLNMKKSKGMNGTNGREARWKSEARTMIPNMETPSPKREACSTDAS
jgi:hypothetical protein